MVLIRLHRCAGWCVSLLFAYSITRFFDAGISCLKFLVFHSVMPHLITFVIFHSNQARPCFKQEGQRFEPCHEIMVLFVLRKLILQTRMCSHPVGLDVWFLIGAFVYVHTSCVRTEKALARLPWLTWAFADRLCDKYNYCTNNGSHFIKVLITT